MTNSERDDLLLSRHLDGRLSAEEAERLAARLDAEPELAARWAAMRRLQAIAGELEPSQAEFTAEDVRARSLRAAPDESSSAGRTWRPWAAAAAAVLALAVTHFSAYRLGARDRDAELAAATPIEETEAVLRRLAELDPGIPPERLDTELAGLREDLRPLPNRLSDYVREQPRDERRMRAAHLADALVQIELAFESTRDPGFRAMTVRTMATGSLQGTLPLRFLPATAHRWARVDPVDHNRFRVVVVRRVGGLPRLDTDVGTIEELRVRHEDIQFVTGD